MSFADDSGFLGACLVETPTDDPRSAVVESYRQGCNPGGEVKMMPVPRLADGYELNKLYSKADLAAIDGEEPTRW